MQQLRIDMVKLGMQLLHHGIDPADFGAYLLRAGSIAGLLALRITLVVGLLADLLQFGDSGEFDFSLRARARASRLVERGQLPALECREFFLRN